MKRLKHSFDDLLSSLSSLPASSDIEHIILSTTPKRDKKSRDFELDVVSTGDQNTQVENENEQANPFLFKSLLNIIATAKANGQNPDFEDILNSITLLSEVEACSIVRYLYSLRFASSAETILWKYMNSKFCGDILLEVVKYPDQHEVSKSQLQKLRLWLLFVTLFKYETSQEALNLIEKNRRLAVRKSMSSSELVEYSTLLDCLYSHF